MKTPWIAAALAVGLAAGTAGAQEVKKSWTDTLTWKGDVRYRFQSTDEEGKEEQPRLRNRFRARLSLDAKVNEDVKAGVRIVTNAGEPITDHVTMSGSFDDKPARIDRAFLDWKVAEGLNLAAGKMAQPWIAVSDLVFSADMNPEGVVARAKLGLDEGADLIASAGYWVVQERATAGETSFVSAQAALQLKPAEQTSVVFGASLFAFDGVEGEQLLFDEAKSFGNTTRKVGAGDAAYLVYGTGFTVVEGFARVEFNAGLPVAIGGQYAVNTEADRDDTAFLGEIRLGKASAPRSWEVGYQYRELEKDSVLGVFAENTDTGNGTNVRAHIPYVRYAVSKNFDIKLQYAIAEKGLNNGTDLNTFKADFTVGF